MHHLCGQAILKSTVSMNESLSIQRMLYPESTCFGCGQANSRGLRLQSFHSEGGVVATFLPGEEHGNGMGALNGGIIATILDCHSGAAVLSESSAGSDTLVDLWVTAGLNIRYRLPTSVDGTCELFAQINEKSDSSMIVSASLSASGKMRVQAESRWARVRPR
jgi:acyl-coenzyme A thioesterase PaaI-like protein